MICALRRVDMPIEAVRQVLDDPDDEALRALLCRHRQRLTDRAQILAPQVSVVDQYIENGVAHGEHDGPGRHSRFGLLVNEEVSRAPRLPVPPASRCRPGVRSPMECRRGPCGPPVRSLSSHRIGRAPLPGTHGPCRQHGQYAGAGAAHLGQHM